MDFLKELFGDKPLSFNELSSKVTEKGLKIADLSKGEYVAVAKFNEMKTKHDTLKTQYGELEKSIKGDEGAEAKIKTLTAERDDFKTKFEQSSGELSSLKSMKTVTDAGIKPEFAGYVASEVGKQVTDTLDFDTALKGYMAKNPQFKGGTPNLLKKTQHRLWVGVKAAQAKM
jgi:hypothetical protein